MTRFLVLGNPENRRVTYFSAACERLGLPKPTVLPWVHFLSDSASLLHYIQNTDALRIESPGENWLVEKLLVKLGGGEVSTKEEYESGLIKNQASWYRGWSKCLSEIKRIIDTGFPVMNPPDDIALMFDKYKCQQLS